MAKRKTKVEASGAAAFDITETSNKGFAAHPHATQMWVDESTGEFYLHERKNLKVVERPEGEIETETTEN